MGIVVVGSLAFDDIKTPFGEVKNVLGGSALYFSAAASFFNSVSIVAVVGDDFNFEEIKFLENKNVDLSNVVTEEGKTFHWKGYYDFNLNEAHTIETHLNVFAGFKPELKGDIIEEDFLFLANIDPELQLRVIEQMKNPRFIAADTMNYWIENKRDKVAEVFSKVDAITINEAEIRQFTGEFNLKIASKKILDLGVRYVIIKRGEYGVLMIDKYGRIFFTPAYLLDSVFDPTGAGDSFAGGMMGYLSINESVEDSLRKSIVYGSVMASYNVEDFSIKRLKELSASDIEKRYNHFLSYCEIGSNNV